jgi:Putative zinc-finger
MWSISQLPAAMNCDEAREWFPALLDGQMSLTDGVLVEAHTGRCRECQELLEQIQKSKVPRRGSWLHVSVSRVSEPSEPPGAQALPDLSPHIPHRLLPATVFRPFLVVVSLTLVTALGVHFAGRSPEPEPEVAQVEAPSMLAAEPSPTRPPAVQPEVPPASQSPAVQPKVSPTPSPTAQPQAFPAPLAGARAKESSPTLLALSPRPERPAPATAADSPKADVLTGAAAPKSLPAADVASPSKPSREGAAPSQSPAPAPPSQQREPAAEPVSPATDPPSDVVMQLAVKDRTMAMRHVRSLLARLGGTAQGRDQGATILVVVPEAQYSEFTHGLARIGTWQLEAERSSLPDPVRVTVRMVR